MGRNREEANDGCGATISETRLSEEERLQLGQCYGELGGIVVVQLELALGVVVSTIYPHVERDQVVENLDWGGERNIERVTRGVFDV